MPPSRAHRRSAGQRNFVDLVCGGWARSVWNTNPTSGLQCRNCMRNLPHYPVLKETLTWWSAQTGRVIGMTRTTGFAKLDNALHVVKRSMPKSAQWLQKMSHIHETWMTSLNSKHSRSCCCFSVHAVYPHDVGLSSSSWPLPDCRTPTRGPSQSRGTGQPAYLLAVLLVRPPLWPRRCSCGDGRGRGLGCSRDLSRVVDTVVVATTTEGMVVATAAFE
mmetsp:Transcript_134307/g.261562  ORF Transcript_134307/g.261562 Transcript_134307/m.261562 type:complete len:218 (-) Transcript_134307:53-706(-)